MSLLRAMFRVLSILAVVGLVSSSLAAPSVAGGTGMTVSAPSSDDGVAAAAMPDDMPCCPPDNVPTPDCQKACPLAALCLPKCVGGTGMGHLAPFRLSYGTRLTGADQVVPDGPDRAPPPKPPKS